MDRASVVQTDSDSIVHADTVHNEDEAYYEVVYGMRLTMRRRRRTGRRRGRGGGG